MKVILKVMHSRVMKSLIFASDESQILKLKHQCFFLIFYSVLTM